MGSRKTGDGAEKVYAAAQKWVDCALRSDDSLFTPGVPIWSSRWLGELREHFLDQPDTGEGSFYDKLRTQLEDSPPEVYQLMGEALYVYYLIQYLRKETKQERIAKVLDWSPAPVPIPPDLEAGLHGRFVNIGRGGGLIHLSVGRLIESVEQWKQLDSTERDRLLSDPWAFKSFLSERQFVSRILVGKQSTSVLMSHLLLHIAAGY